MPFGKSLANSMDFVRFSLRKFFLIFFYTIVCIRIDLFK